MSSWRGHRVAYPHTQRSVTRICGSMLLTGAVLTAFLTLINPDYARGHDTLMLGFCAIAIGYGLPHVIIPDRMPFWAVRISPLLATALMGVTSWATQAPADGTELLMIWPVLFASYFLSTRDGWVNVVAVLAMYAPTAITALGGNGITPIAYMAGTTVIVMLIVSALRRHLQRLIRALEREARTDGLTGLMNRRAWDEMFEREVDRLHRHGGALSLLIVDIDNFKRINDTMGHPAGDEVLRKVAALLQTQVRDLDVLGRMGGEEFAVMLVNCGVEDAMNRAERIRSLIEDAAPDWPAAIAEVTVSIGVATMPDHAASAAALISLADGALYAAKTGGRNRVDVPELAAE